MENKLDIKKVIERIKKNMDESLMMIREKVLEEHERGSGRTTDQMKNAPKGSIFIWCNCHIDYPKKLAKELGRDDLVIIGLDSLNDNGYFAGRYFTHVAIDHAAALTPEQIETFKVWVLPHIEKSEL